MSQDEQQQILETLREIRDGQREMMALMREQKKLAEEQSGRVGTFFVPTRSAGNTPAWAQKRAHPTWLV